MTGQAGPPNTLASRSQALWDGVGHLWEQVVLLAPRVLSALAVLLGLWVVALALRSVVRRVLGMTKLDAALESTPVGRILHAFGKGLSPSRRLGHARLPLPRASLQYGSRRPRRSLRRQRHAL